MQRRVSAKGEKELLQTLLAQIELSAIYNFKGGVGKSTLAINLATYIASKGIKTVLWDCDLQANSSGGLLPVIKKPTLTEVLRDEATLDQAIRLARPNLWIVPASSNLDKAEKYIGDDLRKLRRLLHALLLSGGMLDPETGQRVLPEKIIFDTAGLTGVTKSAILCAQNLIIPIEYEFFSFQGIATVQEKLDEVLTEQEHSVYIKAVVPFSVNESRKLTKAYYNELRQDEDLGDSLYPAVHVSVSIPESQGETKSIFEYAPNSRAAKELGAVAQYYLGELDLEAYLLEQEEEAKRFEEEAALKATQVADAKRPGGK